jgi:transcriptional regulator with XRE-family HTH domain
MSDLAQRIRQRLDDLGLSQKELADSCGISAPAVNDWLSGKTKSLKAATLLKAAKALAVNPQWLESGVGLKSIRQEHRVAEPSYQTDPVTQQLQRAIEHMLPEDQRKMLEYAELLALKRLHEQKKQRVTGGSNKS